MNNALIHVPTKNAMQSGKNNTKKWVLEFDQDDSSYIDNLMGWIGSKDTSQEIRIAFATKEAAIKFAEKRKIPYQVIEPNPQKLVIKSYAENFTD